MIYAGAARPVLPITMGDIRILLTALVGLTAFVLVFVLRTEGMDKDFSLPDGLSLADPARRLIACGIDAGVALVVVSRVLDVPLRDVTTAEGLSGPNAVWLAIGLIVTGAIIGTLAELFWGRTLGKLVVGCAVVALVPGGVSRVSLVASALRNLIKWGMPPVAMMALLDPSGRHRGEALSRTAVVVEATRPDNKSEPDNRDGPQE